MASDLNSLPTSLPHSVPLGMSHRTLSDRLQKTVNAATGLSAIVATAVNINQGAG